MNTIEKGLYYERYVKDYIIKNFNKEVYLWNECPEKILIEHKLVASHNHLRNLRKEIKEGYLHNHKDIGIDLIQIENNDISIIQVKNGYSQGVNIDDLSGIMLRTSFSRKNTYIYYTHSLSKNIIKIGELSQYVRFINNYDEIFINTEANIHFIHLPIYNNIIKTIDINPYPYQLEAYEKIKNHFLNNNRGILSLPCGCGKTYISYLISQKYSHIIILSPLKEFTKQNLNKFIEYGYDKSNSLLVDTDGNRDIKYIKEFINNHKNLVISTTYLSMDLIIECLDLFKNSLFIIDEFHNLSKSNIFNENDNINKLLNSKNKILYISATPKIYDIENYNSKEYREIIGDMIYHMKYNEAIDNKYITDYKIWLPPKEDKNIELYNNLSIYNIDYIYFKKCNYLFSCLLNNGSRKIIIYCIDTNDMNKMMKNIKILNNFYILDLNINSISCENSDNERKKRLELFQNNNDKIQLLFNIKILNECIDIPSCDSIYISYIPKNKITTIQRLSRATRIDKNNPYKIANIYLWCDKYDDVKELLSSINEYDINLKYKININEINFYNNNKKIINDISKFSINLDEVVKLLMTKKGKIKETLLNSYKLNEDYIINKNNNTGKRGAPLEQILLSIKCFNLLCMKSKTKKGYEIREKFFSLDEINIKKFL